LNTIKINTDWIKLDQVLKLADAAQSGGHAKLLIQDGLVKVNGIIENQRGKKIKNGDIVEVEDIEISVIKE